MEMGVSLREIFFLIDKGCIYHVLNLIYLSTEELNFQV